MLETPIVKADAATFHLGQLLTIDDLPPRFNRRWSAEQKRQLLAAIDGGLLTAHEAAARYSLDRNEFAAWREDQGVVPVVAALPHAVAPTSVDRLARLIDVLLERRVIDEADVAALDMPRDVAWQSCLSRFMVEDSPLF